MLIRLKTYPDNREFAATLTPLADRWGWIRDEIAFEFGCDPDDVSTREADEDCEHDLITVRGEVVARLETKAGWAALS